MGWVGKLKQTMKINTIKTLLLLLIPAVFMACGSKNKSEENTKNEAKIKADLVEQAAFVTLKGDTINVSDFKGKVVMLDFWETWCKPCISSFPAVDSLLQQYSKNFAAIAVTAGWEDTKEDAQAFAKEHDYDFIYAMDIDSLSKKLNVRSIPFKVFIGPDGKFIKTSKGSSGPEKDYKKIEKMIEKYSGNDRGTI